MGWTGVPRTMWILGQGPTWPPAGLQDVWCCEARGLLPTSGLQYSSLPMPASCRGLRPAKQVGLPHGTSWRGGGTRPSMPRQAAQRTSSSGDDEEAAGHTQALHSAIRFPLAMVWGCPCSRMAPGRTLGWHQVPLGSLRVGRRRRRSGMLGGPRRPQENRAPGGPSRDAQAGLAPPAHWPPGGAGPPARYSPAPQRPPPAWWQPPPVRRCSPSGEASGTNQPPGVVRPSGWGLIDTRWPLPRGRLGGGSAQQGGQAPGRAGGLHPGPAGSGLPWGDEGGQAAAGHSSRPLLPAASIARPSPASLGSDLSFISETAGTVTASAQEEGGSGFCLAGRGQQGVHALGLRWPGPASGMLRRATHCGRRGVPKPSFIDHLLHAGPRMVPVRCSERWVVMNSTLSVERPRLREAKLLP